MIGNGKIIVVEDNEYDFEFISLSLKTTSFKGEIIWLKNGQEFLNYLLEKSAKDIVFVLMDMKMPLLNGVETLRALPKEFYKLFPIIMFSASKHEKDILTCQSLGACAYVTKPIDFDEFEGAIQTIWNFWGKINEIMHLRLKQN